MNMIWSYPNRFRTHLKSTAARVSSSFPDLARREEETVALGHGSEEQHRGAGKEPKPEGMRLFSPDRFVAAGLEYPEDTPAPLLRATDKIRSRRGLARIFEMGSGRSILLFSIFYFLFSHTVSAATFRLYFLPEAGAGGEFAVRILVDSDQPVNAYSIIANYDPSALALAATDNSHSIIDIWHEEPVISQSGSIEFKGGSLKAFTGSAGELMTLRFRALHAGMAQLQFGKSSLYLANGKGTRVVPNAQPVQFSVPEYQGGAVPPAGETTPPQFTFLSLAPDPFNASQKFLTYSAIDPGSGIQNVFYRHREWLFWSDKAQAVNPIVLPRNAWAVDIEARDTSGNVTEKTIYDWTAFFWGPFLLVAVLIAALFVIRRARGV